MSCCTYVYSYVAYFCRFLYVNKSSFQKKYKEHTNNKHLGQLDFTLQLIRQLGNINEDSPVPIYNPTDIKIKEHHAIVMIQDDKKNCKQCYTLTKKQVKTVFYCKTCGHSFCLTSKRNCMLKAHFISSN